MNEALNRLLAAYGRNEFVAEALGYSDRKYRNIRRKIKKGEALPARTVELITLKLQQLHIQRTQYGVGFEVLCKRFNHENPTVTMRYLGISDSEVVEILQNEV